MFRLAHDAEVARLALDRPEARNAIPAAGWAALRRLLGDIGPARVLVISGADGAFCAGADLSDLAAMRDDAGARVRFRESMRGALDALRALPIPTIARIDGACYGAGVALAMACDLRVATARSQFAITPARIGISYPQEDVHRLVALVGAAQAARLLFTAQTIDGAEALRIGLVEPDDAYERAILANDSTSLAVLKRAIALAGSGVRSDAGHDRRFDELIGDEAVAHRLEALRRR